MLAILAALVPVLASLWVAGGTLVDHARQAHEARVAARVWGQYTRDVEAIADGTPNLGDRMRELTERRMRLLEASGLDPWVGTVRNLNESVMPKPPSVKELRRQWVLIIGAIAGVVLVAMQVALDASS